MESLPDEMRKRHEELVPDRLGRLFVMRSLDEKAGTGVVACMARKASDGLPMTERLERFATTLDFGLFGELRYVFAEAKPGASTHVIAIWTDAHLPITAMFPATGDAPGTDSDLAARPRDARRLFVGQAEGTPYAIRMYEAAGSREELVASYTADMKGRGWIAVENPDAPKHVAAFVHPSGVEAYVAASAGEDRGHAVLSVAETGDATSRGAADVTAAPETP
jgi:hypothetical protein